MQISVSRLRAYSLCPQKYFYRYVANEEPEFVSVNLTFGSAMHHALCKFHQSRNTIGSNGMYHAFMKYWNAMVAECEATQKQLRYGKQTEGDLLDKGYNLCVEYVGQFQDIVPASSDDVEILFECPLYDPEAGWGSLEHSLTGRIDLVANRSIYEFKTASRAPSQTDADTSIQLTAYALAHQYLFDEPPEQMFLVALVKTQKPKIVVLKTTRWYKDSHDLIDMARQIARAIEADVFYRNRETQWGCHTCEYEKKCLGFRPQKSASGGGL